MGRSEGRSEGWCPGEYQWRDEMQAYVDGFEVAYGNTMTAVAERTLQRRFEVPIQVKASAVPGVLLSDTGYS